MEPHLQKRIHTAGKMQVNITSDHPQLFHNPENNLIFIQFHDHEHERDERFHEHLTKNVFKAYYYIKKTKKL